MDQDHPWRRRKTRILGSIRFWQNLFVLGVKEVSPVVPPSKVNAQFANEVVGNHIEREQTSGDKLNEPNLGMKKVLSKQRPAVQFKIKRSRKLLGLAPGSSFRDEGVHERDRSSVYDNGIKNESKSAGKAPKESSMESPKERVL
ncbi:hypothetical protein CDL15_Pgr004589 [Punica granatum]|uniref:Uncharacterized protein n=1 Tax=Punica granatum TaxID=22663 RepID=A0A218WS66_PUNGR|nr:hypothetical protein CDL15_Pgr004589 [Punica granatum]